MTDEISPVLGSNAFNKFFTLKPPVLPDGPGGFNIRPPVLPDSPGGFDEPANFFSLLPETSEIDDFEPVSFDESFFSGGASRKEPDPRSGGTSNKVKSGTKDVSEMNFGELTDHVNEAKSIENSGMLSFGPMEGALAFSPSIIGSVLGKKMMAHAAEQERMKALDALSQMPQTDMMDIAQIEQMALSQPQNALGFADNLFGGAIGFGANFTPGPVSKGAFGDIVGTVQIADDVSVPAYDTFGFYSQPKSTIGTIDSWDGSMDPTAPPGFGPNNPAANGGNNGGGGGGFNGGGGGPAGGAPGDRSRDGGFR